MKNVLLVIVSVLLAASSVATACEVTAVKTAVAASDRALAVAVASLPEVAQEVTQWIELPEIPELAEIRGLSHGVRAVALCASSEENGCGAGVLYTVVKALGKAVLRGIATVVHEIV